MADRAQSVLRSQRDQHLYNAKSSVCGGEDVQNFTFKNANIPLFSFGTAHWQHFSGTDNKPPKTLVPTNTIVISLNKVNNNEYLHVHNIIPSSVQIQYIYIYLGCGTDMFNYAHYQFIHTNSSTQFEPVRLTRQ